MSEQKVAMSEELALAELKRWAEANEVDLTTKNSQGERVFDAGVPKLVRPIQQGRLVVNDKGEFEYVISQKSPEGIAGEKLTLAAPTGAAYMTTDKFTMEEGVHRTLALASAMTGKDIAWFAKLHNSDYKVVSNIVSFFVAG